MWNTFLLWSGKIFNSEWSRCRRKTNQGLNLEGNEVKGLGGGWKIKIKGQWVIAVAWEAVWDKSNHNFNHNTTLSSDHEHKNPMANSPELIVLQEPMIGPGKGLYGHLCFFLYQSLTIFFPHLFFIVFQPLRLADIYKNYPHVSRISCRA